MTTANKDNRLILMRHAKSDWYSGADDDYLRPLSQRGVRDSRLMGQWLAEEGYLPERILSSPATRTRETLKLMAAGAGTDLESITQWCEALYLASAPTICDVLRRHGRASGVMIVAHNPGLEEFLAWLVTGGELAGEFRKVFPTGAAYILRCERSLDDLSGGCASIRAHQRPKMLSD